MSYIADTDVVSELRKRERPGPAVVEWFRNRNRASSISASSRSASCGSAPNGRAGKVFVRYRRRIPDVDSAAAERWGRIGASDPPPDADGLSAATAPVRDFVVVTRNAKHIAPTRARY